MKDRHDDGRSDDERLVRRGFWGKVRSGARRVPFLEDALAAYYCAMDPVTPRAAKAILFGALAYFVLPADVVPDWILGFGFSDDAAALLAALHAVRSNLRPEHYQRARTALAEGTGGSARV